MLWPKRFAALCLVLAPAGSPTAPTSGAQMKPAAAQPPALPAPTREVQALLEKADALAKAAKWPEAIAGYEAARMNAQAHGDRTGEAAASGKSGNIYLNANEPKKALEYYEQALAIHRSVGNRQFEAITLSNIGNVCANTGQPQKALAYYEQALPIHRAVGDRVGEARTLNNMGSVYSNSSEPKKALEYFERALSIRHAEGDRRGEAATLTNMGNVYAEANQPQKALEYYAKALPIHHAVGNIRLEANALGNIGNAYSRTGQLEKALVYYEQALPIYHAIGNQQFEAKTLGNIGHVYSDIGQPQKALEYYEQALPMYRAIGDRSGEANILNRIGAVYFNTGQPTKALEHYEQALTIHRTVSDRGEEAGTLVKIGNIYTNTGQPKKALQYYEQALPMYRAISDRGGEAAALSNIGAVFSTTGQPKKALEYYELALPSYRIVGDRGGEASTLTNIGLVYSDIGQPTKALEHYQLALPIHRYVGNKQFEANTLGNIGIIYMSTGQPQKALGYYELAMPIYRAVGDRRGEANTLNNVGLFYGQTGRPQKALEYYEQALTIHRAVGNKQSEAIALANIGTAHAAAKQPKAALTAYRQAIRIYEQVRQAVTPDPQSRQAYLLTALDTYYRTIALLIQQHQIPEAFALAQKTKGRSLLDILDSGKADVSALLTPEERRQEQELREQADDLNRQMMKQGVENAVGAKRRFAALAEQLKQAEQKLDTLTVTLNARHPGLADRRAARTATLAEIPRFLPADAALLEYLQIDRNRIALFVVTNDAGRPKVRGVMLKVDGRTFGARCAALHDACADPRKSWRPLAKQMYRLLLAKAEPLLAGRQRLIVCPDGPLWDVPFAALTDARDRTLLSRYTLGMAYSATGAQAAAAARRTADRRPSGSLLCFANPDFGGATRFGDLDGVEGQRPIEMPSRPWEMPSRWFQTATRPIEMPSRPIEMPSRPIEMPSRPIEMPSRPIEMPSRPIEMPSRQMATLAERGGIKALPGTEREANAIRRDFPDARILTGAEAQEATAKAEMGRYRYLHFATHGFVNNASPMLSSLVLAKPAAGSKEDGFLTAREIFGMSLHADLAVLSACNTGRGERRAGEGVIGLTWALFAAGCPTSVVSGWSVDDAATATLMGGFYHRLKAGEGKAASLRAASLALSRDGRHAHPYYWAAFSLIGDGR